jgi:Anp1
MWRDVDIVDSPKKIIEDFIAHDKDVIVPSRSPLNYPRWSTC